ncbi:hypothetical protein FL966_01805 [Caproiciproducens galactitolivorans]|uniref:Uncharacterized protein n=1 Tax=Caproiciproducens galactitolivorans TaxID=642589 RepID=A0A4Z0XY09_9FIRM|nr:hypothetical protein [Caproiciproducens galactitolivorans]QEY33877.1 hypothetical protein FL966_01805 [Caproiciproducens galactitolivorans]TGJ75387.1 hypothetical protein CAGA_24860 [Caproiciproducens galactitolivorans]
MFGSGKSKEDKQQEQLQKFQGKYHIDELDPRDLETVKQIAADLAGNGFLKAGMALSLANSADQAKVTYLSALVEQNWIIINQLSRLNKNIEKLSKKAE